MLRSKVHGERATPAAAARLVREALGIAAGPVPTNLLHGVESLGIEVAHAPSDSAETDAYSKLGIRPVMVLSRSKNDFYRTRFDIAHELGHLVLHDEGQPSRKEEEEADTFAAALLIPRSQLGPELRLALRYRHEDLDAMWDELIKLKDRWLVSLAALMVEAKDLGLLPERAYRARFIEMKERWGAREPLSRPALDEPTRLEANVSELVRAYGTERLRVSGLLRVPVSVIRTLEGSG